MLTLTLGLAWAAPTVTTDGTCPGPVVFQVSGATPSGPVALLTAPGPGSTPLLAGPCAGTVTGLSRMRRPMTRAADAAGASTIVPVVSGSGCAGWYQVLDLTTCALTEVAIVGASSGSTWSVDVDAAVDSSYPVLGLVRTEDDGVAVAGGDASGAWWVRLDAEGALVGAKTYPIRSAAGLAATADGGFLLAGERDWYDNPAIVRVDADGEVAWANVYDLGWWEQGYYAILEVPGGIRAAGIYDYGFASDGSYAWGMLTIGGGGNVNALDLTLDGGTVSTGEGSYGSPAGDYNAVLTKTDPDGIVAWSRAYGGDGYDWSDDVAALSDGGYAITGWTTSTAAGSACWVGRTDAAGTLSWAATYPGTSSSACHEVLETPSGGLLLAGTLDGSILLLETDASGVVLQSSTHGPGTAYAAVEVDTGWAWAADASGTLRVGRVGWDLASGCEGAPSVGSSPFSPSQTSNGTYGTTDPIPAPVAGSATAPGWGTAAECL